MGNKYIMWDWQPTTLVYNYNQYDRNIAYYNIKQYCNSDVNRRCHTETRAPDMICKMWQITIFFI